MPFFISFFLGIRGLANYPLESMMYGGTLWFPDLTVADPYYILPVFTAITMFVTMEVCGSSNHPIIYFLSYLFSLVLKRVCVQQI
jgi:membrane protein insertase Oxa1/YidC/SpoIIIJ